MKKAPISKMPQNKGLYWPADMEATLKKFSMKETRNLFGPSTTRLLSKKRL
jgi:hypothetical protein